MTIDINETYPEGKGVDITEQERDWEVLRENEEKYRMICGTATDAIIMMDDQGCISCWDLTAKNKQLELEIIQHRRMEEDLRSSEKKLRILSAKLIAAQEKERERVAHELHDSIGQALTAIKFRVENTLGQLDKNMVKGIIESLATVVPVVQFAMEKVRRISMGLRPSTLSDLGLLPTIAWFCREFQGSYSLIRIEKNIEIEEQDIPERLKIDIFRILQESLNNVAKHSNADHVRLGLRKGDGTIELFVWDNGLGFDLEDTMSSETIGKGLGLGSMKERAEISGGRFVIESIKGKGTTVRTIWPVI